MDKMYGVWLVTVLGAGNKFSSLLCEYYSSFKEIYNATVQELMQIEGLGIRQIEKLQNKNLDETNKIMGECARLGIDIVTVFDVKYPTVLKNIVNYPVLLFVLGQLPKETSLCVAVVGSRRPSIYGLKMAEKFAQDLGKAGITIVSGMARGVDTGAHKGALRAGANTVAVLGCGVDIAYPAENKGLKELIRANGAVVSEFLPGTPPLPAHFPIRNRIVSGLSDAVLVIEGKPTSGSTITANIAKDQGREVFCLPGNADNPLSTAPNRLIREGARLVTCAEEMLLDMAVDNPERFTQTIYNEDAKEQERNEKYNSLTSDQRKIAKVLEGSRPMHIDQICIDTGIEIALVNQSLFLLELKGFVKQLPGKQYILCL